MSTEKAPRTVEELEKTRWAELAKDPKVQNKILKVASRLVGRLGKNHPAAKRAQDAMELFAKGRGGELLTGRNIIILGAALVYFISPIDAIPDCIPVIGWLDDIGVIGMVLSALLPAAGKEEKPDPKESTNDEHARRL